MGLYSRPVAVGLAIATGLTVGAFVRRLILAIKADSRS